MASCKTCSGEKFFANKKHVRWNTRIDDREVVEHKTCTYKQIFNINPLMGGFSIYNSTYETSVFNVYQFTGQYKISAQGDQVVLMTATSCSQMSVSFYKALVVFQPKVKPVQRETQCEQKVEYNENEYTIEINPFEQHKITVGTMILATNGILQFTTFNLPSKTNQEKISHALYDYIKTIETKVTPVGIGVEQISLPTKPIPGGYDMFYMDVVSSSVDQQKITLNMPCLISSYLTCSNKFLNWRVIDPNGNKVPSIPGTTNQFIVGKDDYLVGYSCVDINGVTMNISSFYTFPVSPGNFNVFPTKRPY